ncbi:MAG: hypothetical protein LCH67_12590 [Bacteroidetes bacterium]|nr:hypothetical protein [Bacteroidota bacterium]
MLKKLILFLSVLVLTASCLYEKNTDPNPASGTTDTLKNLVTCDGSGNTTPANGDICFNTQILPFFQSNCGQSGCHDSKSRKDGYDLTSYASIIKKGISTSNPSSSKLYRVLFESGEDRMPPPPAAAISKAQADILLAWIKQGAKNTACSVNIDAQNPTYSGVIKPIIDTQCLGCHQTGNASGNITLDSYAKVKALIDNGKLLGSVTYTAGYSAMPPSQKLSDCEITAFQNWKNKGAPNN